MLHSVAIALLAASAGDGGNTSALSPRDQEIQDKRAHILVVVDELRDRTPDCLNPDQRALRHQALDELAAYALRGQFILNTEFPFDMPYFIDPHGTRCAMGHLLEFTGHQNLLLDLAASENNSFISELIDHQGVLEWLDTHGFTVDDIAFIQGPGRDIDPPPVEIEVDTRNILDNPEDRRGRDGVIDQGNPGGARAGGATGRRGSGGSAATATRRRRATANTVTWTRWWELNREGFLDLRNRYAQHQSVTPSPAEDALPAHRPSPEQVRKMIFPILEQSLSDSSDVASTALVSLAQCRDSGNPEEIEKAIRSFMKNTRDPNRDYGLLALGLVGTDSARDALIDVVLDRKEGRKLLGESGSLDERERSLAAIALTECGDASAVDALWQVLESKKSTLIDLRSSCLMALGVLAQDKALQVKVVPGLVKQMNAPTWNAAVVAHVPLALAKVGDPAALAAVANHVRMFRGSREVRQSCALALGMMAPAWEAEVWQGLHDLARRDPDPAARQFAILSLGEIALRSAPADRLSPEEQGILREQAKFHLDALRGSFRQSADMPWHALSAGMFARRHADHSGAIVDQLERMLGSDVRDNRAAAAVALGLSDADGADARLREIMKDSSDPMMKGYAAEALGMSGDEEVTDDLLALVRNDSSAFVRYQAAIGLALMADPSVTDDLVREYTTTNSAPVRGALTRAIGEIGDKRAIPPLTQMATDEDRESLTRAGAAAALGMIGQERELRWTYSIRRAYNFSIAPPTLGEILNLF